MIKITNLTKQYNVYNNQTIALDHINLDLPNSGFVFVLGPSGSGKTTLLNSIGGLDKPDEGEILISNKNICSFNEKEINEYRNKNVGFIFQNCNMISNMNLYDNISMPLRANNVSKKEIDKRVNQLLKRFNLESLNNNKPNQISGGQKQRAAIARAIINNPEIILADEPTGALDTKNTKIVMEILKEISKERLIIMVTHNESLAFEYGDRIIKLLDGKIESDEEINKCFDIKKDEKSSKSKLFNIIAGLKIAFSSMLSKKIRTIFTILATAIGIISTSLVLIVSNSMANYTEYAQKQALGTYPITISSNVGSEDAIESKDYEAYPSNNIINITNDYASYYSHINVFDNDYIEYINNLPSNLYSVIDYGSTLNMNILVKNSEGYLYLSSSSYLKRLNDKTNYLSEEYDLLYGESYPSSKNELALVIDKNNCIDAYVLDYLGIDYENIDHYTFEEMCGKEFKVVRNNDLYIYDDEDGIYKTYSNKENLYNNSDITLKITCILRAKKTATMKLYSTGLLYTDELFEYMHNDCCESNVVKDQLKYGVEKNVFSGYPYQDSISSFQTVSKEYVLENNLKTLGYYYKINYIKIYTDKFENRTSINKYLEAYNTGKSSEDKILYSDYMGSLTQEFEKFINILTNVLILFSTISLLIAAIMIALLMYVSVIERTKEIGLLRSVGFSKLNILTVFVTEAGIIGIIAGIIGQVCALVCAKPILSFVSNVVEESYSSSFDLTEITKVSLNPLELILIIIGSALVAIIASLIPAIIASNKEPVKSINYQAN